ERIARRTAEGSRSYLLASGTRAALPEGSSLLGSPWLLVWEVQRAAGRAADGTGAVIRAAAPLEEEDALGTGRALLVAERCATLDGAAVRVREVRRLGAIELTSTPVTATAEDTVPAVLAQVRSRGLEALSPSASARSLRARLGLLHRELGAPWPAMDEESLLTGLETWLAPQVSHRTTRLDQIDLASGLRLLLPWPEASRLEELAPERLAVPSGSTARLDCPEPGDPEGRPVVAVKLQELFGLAETPRLVDGRVPVLFHLLSPARRPLAVTDDLRSFWDGSYQQVRKEMRGRYPKHPWPEDPWTAPATARTTRATRRRARGAEPREFSAPAARRTAGGPGHRRGHGIHGPPEGLRGGVVHREGLDGLVDLATPHAIEVTLEDPVGDPQGPQQLEDDPVLEAGPGRVTQRTDQAGPQGVLDRGVLGRPAGREPALGAGDRPGGGELLPEHLGQVHPPMGDHGLEPGAAHLRQRREGPVQGRLPRRARIHDLYVRVAPLGQRD